jgi:hypothetical protein
MLYPLGAAAGGICAPYALRARRNRLAATPLQLATKRLRRRLRGLSCSKRAHDTDMRLDNARLECQTQGRCRERFKRVLALEPCA